MEYKDEFIGMLEYLSEQIIFDCTENYGEKLEKLVKIFGSSIMLYFDLYSSSFETPAIIDINRRWILPVLNYYDNRFYQEEPTTEELKTDCSIFFVKGKFMKRWF